MKFGRRYRLTVETNEDDEAIIIEDLTIEFNIVRSTMASLNSMKLSIYNLNQESRNKIFQDRFNPKTYKKIVLQAGYDNLSIIFIGNIFEAHSARNGVNIITTIDARDGGFDTVSELTSKTLPAGTSFRDLISNLISDFPNLQQGNIGNIEGATRRPVVLDGNTFQLIRKYSDDSVYIDLETVNVLTDNDVVEGDLPLITSETGLLATPRRADSYLTIDTIFEPRIIMGQLLDVKSDISPQFDGQYKVIGLSHAGIISQTVGGQLTSKFNLLVGSQILGGFNEIA